MVCGSGGGEVSAWRWFSVDAVMTGSWVFSDLDSFIDGRAVPLEQSISLVHFLKPIQSKPSIPLIWQFYMGKDFRGQCPSSIKSRVIFLVRESSCEGKVSPNQSG